MFYKPFKQKNPSTYSVISHVENYANKASFIQYPL